MSNGNDTVIMPNGTLGHFDGGHNGPGVSSVYNAALLTQSLSGHERVTNAIGDKALHQAFRTDDDRYFTSRQLGDIRSDIKDKICEQERECARRSHEFERRMEHRFDKIAEKFCDLEKAALAQQLAAAKEANADLKQAAQTNVLLEAIKALCCPVTVPTR